MRRSIDAGALRRPSTAAGTVGGSVPATLSLTLGAPASSARSPRASTQDYTASTTANVISTAGDARSPYRPRPSDQRRVHAAGAAAGRARKSSWTAPISNDPVTIAFKQHDGRTDPLRTGTYSKTLTFTLSTTTP